MSEKQAKSSKSKVIPIISVVPTAPAIPASRLDSHEQCPRRAWLETHRPELAEEADDAAYWQLQSEAVNKAAQRQFAGAFSIQENFEEGLAMTKALMTRHPSGTFFDASFLVRNVHVRPDVLESRSKGLLVSEISSGTLRGQRLDKDKLARFSSRLGITGWALAQKRLKPVQYAVHALDRDAVWDGKDPSYQGLLTRIDLTEAVKAAKREVPARLAELNATLALAKEPVVRVTRHCKKPFPCPFVAHCKQDARRPETTIYDIPGKFWAVQDRWASLGYYDLKKVPRRELDAVSPELKPILDSLLSGVEWRSRKAARLLAALPFPRYFFDFEAISLALPAWEGRRPYEQVPFQWSVHVEKSPGVFSHRAFLELSGKDPVRSCALALLKSLGKKGPVLVYHAAYESTRLKEMAAAYPDLADALLAVQSRLVDLELWVRDTYYHPLMGGSYSLKRVLPCLAPECDYSVLDGVRNGVDAQFAYLSAIGAGFDRKAFLATRNRMLDYCSHDTWAMVAVAYRLAGKKIPVRPVSDKRPAGVSTFIQARIKAANASSVWQLWERERPVLTASANWVAPEQASSAATRKPAALPLSPCDKATPVDVPTVSRTPLRTPARTPACMTANSRGTKTTSKKKG